MAAAASNRGALRREFRRAAVDRRGQYAGSEEPVPVQDSEGAVHGRHTRNIASYGWQCYAPRLVFQFSILDILASVLLMIVMMRRLEVRSLSAADHVHLAPGLFASWQARSMRVYGFMALACVLKMVAGQLWLGFALPRVTPAVTVVSGLLIDGAWMVALVVGWKRATDLGSERLRLRLMPSRKRP